MVLDLHTSSKTAVANWTGDSVTPDITIEPSGGTHASITADIITLGQTGGGRPVEGIPTFGGKNITKETPQEDFEISFDAAFTNSRYFAMFMGSTAYSAGTQYTNTTTQNHYRITITWQDPEAITESAAEKLRIVYKDVVMTAWEPDHTGDEYLKGTMTFKVTPFDSSGNSNIFVEYETAASFTTLAADHGGAEDSYTYVG